MDAVSFIATSYLVMSAVEAAAWALSTAGIVLYVFGLFGLLWLIGRATVDKAQNTSNFHSLYNISVLYRTRAVEAAAGRQ